MKRGVSNRKAIFLQGEHYSVFFKKDVLAFHYIVLCKIILETRYKFDFSK
jgi:hypothetical protein